MRDSLRVAIDARLAPTRNGGVAQAALGLIHALGELEGRETYDIVSAGNESREFIEPHIGPNQRLIERPSANLAGPRQRLKQSAKARLARAVESQIQPWPTVPISDGFYERIGADVLHFPTQGFVLCSLPTIYNPHDLQHRHLPEFFPPHVLAARDVLYTTACRLAHTVTVASRWVKQDIIDQYGTSPTKIQVIPWAAPTQMYATPVEATIHAVRARYDLPEEFLFYPAKTWRHKNHAALFDALAILRNERNVRPLLVCTGGMDSDSSGALMQHVADLDLADQIRFLGYVDEDEIRPLYRLAQALVLPTLFESDSFPIFEAWAEGLPVACSNVTSLPEQVGDAALVFEPDPRAIAEAVGRMIEEPELRATLAARGRARAQRFNWELTAKAYRAVYRRAARRSLSDEDRELLAWDWMVEDGP